MVNSLPAMQETQICSLGQEDLLEKGMAIHSSVLAWRIPLRFAPWVRKISWRREWLFTPVFLPGEFHEQRSLVGCSPWGFKESHTTEQLNTFTSLHMCIYTSMYKCKYICSIHPYTPIYMCVWHKVSYLKQSSQKKRNMPSSIATVGLWEC